MFKKYETWWLIVTSVSLFIVFNWLIYILFGLSMIQTLDFDRGLVQVLIGVISTFVSLVSVLNDFHTKE